MWGAHNVCRNGPKDKWFIDQAALYVALGGYLYPTLTADPNSQHIHTKPFNLDFWKF